MPETLLCVGNRLINKIDLISPFISTWKRAKELVYKPSEGLSYSWGVRKSQEFHCCAWRTLYICINNVTLLLLPSLLLIAGTIAVSSATASLSLPQSISHANCHQWSKKLLISFPFKKSCFPIYKVFKGRFKALGDLVWNSLFYLCPSHSLIYAPVESKCLTTTACLTISVIRITFCHYTGSSQRAEVVSYLCQWIPLCKPALGGTLDIS